MTTMGLAIMTSLQIVLNQLGEFNARNFDVLFSQYYSPRLEVYQHPDFGQLRELITTLNDGSATAVEKKHAIDKAIDAGGANLFPDLEVLKSHVRKQFSSQERLHVEVMEQGAFENYVVLFERKQRDGIVIDAVDIYFVEDGMIRKMWIAKR